MNELCSCFLALFSYSPPRPFPPPPHRPLPSPPSWHPVHFQLFLFPAVAVTWLPHNGGRAAALTEMFISFRKIDSQF